MPPKPKARKFRIRRSRPVRADAPDATNSPPAPTVRRRDPRKTRRSPAVATTGSAKSLSRAPPPPAGRLAPTEDPAKVQAALEAIAGEGLTGRQLRMARPARGETRTDPGLRFRCGPPPARTGHRPPRALEPSPAFGAGTEEKRKHRSPPQGPQGRRCPRRSTRIKVPGPAGPPPDIAARRAAEILAMQADIARRRRRKIGVSSGG